MPIIVLFFSVVQAQDEPDTSPDPALILEHEGRIQIQYANWSCDGNFIVTTSLVYRLITSDFYRINVWDSQTGELLTAIDVTEAEEELGNPIINPDGTQILVVIDNEIIKSWDISTGEEIFARIYNFWQLSDTAFALTCFEPDKSWTSDDDRFDYDLLQASVGSETIAYFPINANETYVLGVSRHNDDEAAHSTIFVWDATTLELLHTIKYVPAQIITIELSSANGSFFHVVGWETSGRGGLTWLYAGDAATGDIRFGMQSYFSPSVAWDRKGNLMAFGVGGEFLVWDAINDVVLVSTEPDLVSTEAGGDYFPNVDLFYVRYNQSMVWSSQGSRLITYTRKEVQIWDFED